jgi:hypothetical protein
VALYADPVSTNVPLNHWSYDAIDKLADYGLIDGAMLTVRPITRLEMARHIAQATASLNRMNGAPDVLQSIVGRLQEEFRDELIQIGALDGWHSSTSAKPIEDPYAKYLYATERPNLENTRGDVFDAHSNYRAGFASRATVADTAAFYVHPEFRAASSDSDRDVDLIEGYGKTMAGPVEVEAGRDSLWWGPARRGSMLMSDNAQPLTMVKIANPQPAQLPWIFSYLGPFKAEWFFAQLEKDRDFPNANLSGMRINFKPHPLVELGVSRVMMFGGWGQPHVGFLDYIKQVSTTYEVAENDQLAGFDVSVRLPLPDNTLLRSVKLYMDAAGEDTAGALPSKWGRIIGLQLSDLLRTGRTDLRVEYADDHVRGAPGVFYTHGLYTSGYSFDGRVIGHYMGTDSRDASIELSHYLSGDLVVKVMFDRVMHDYDLEPVGAINILQYSLTWFASSDWRIEAAYRYENGEGRGYDDNHILQVMLARHF